MKQTIFYSGLLLATSGLSTVFAQDVVVMESPDGTPYVPDQNGGPPPDNNPPAAPSSSSAPPAAATSSTPSPPPSDSSSSGTQSSGNQICINFSGGDFHFLNTGSWGSNSGQGAQAASQCFDLNPNGAMFICDGPCDGSGDAAAAKYTKLECTFGGEYENCDMSIVDGFSLPVQCDIPGATPGQIGGLQDLNTLTSCPSPAPDNTCANTGAYGSSESSVAQYFENANGGSGGNYCVYQYCSKDSDAFFTGTPTISCQVGSLSSGQKKREAQQPAEAEAEHTLRSRSSRHGHSHHAKVHARGLTDVLSHEKSGANGWMFR